MKSGNAGIENEKKKTLGKRKIEIKKIEKSSSRQVTFCKRRKGLFTKAAELCISTGAEVGILVQSLGGKTYSFGHPNIESVINHYLTGVSTWSNTGEVSGDVVGLKHEYDMVCRSLEEEKRKVKKVNNYDNFWWNEDVENVGFEELENYGTALEELKRNVMVRGDELMLLEISDQSRAVGLIDHGGYFLDHAARDQDMNSQQIVCYGSSGAVTFH